MLKSLLALILVVLSALTPGRAFAAVGDLVWSCDEATGADCTWRRVHAVIVGYDDALVEVEVAEADGGVDFVATTPGHPFYVDGRGWVAAEWLEVGDGLYSPMGSGSRVVGVLPIGERYTAYNLTVAVGHTFFVRGGEDGGGVWVHNCGRARRSFGLPEHLGRRRLGVRSACWQGSSGCRQLQTRGGP